MVDSVEAWSQSSAFDLVHCTSVLVIEPRYRELLAEMYRVSNRFVLADMRLLKDLGSPVDPKESYYRIQFEG
jgi:ubiquinone/menaquinone biosynthesis C-methylase UbiE